MYGIISKTPCRLSGSGTNPVFSRKCFVVSLAGRKLLTRPGRVNLKSCKLMQTYFSRCFGLFIFLLLVSAAVLSPAQEAYRYLHADKKFFGGLAAGMNISQVDGDTYSGFHRVGLNAGGIVYWRMHPAAGLSLEFLYSQKGARGVRSASDYNLGAYFEKYNIRLKYVEAPLVFYFFPKDRYHVGLGASFNALLSSSESLERLGPVYFEQEAFPFEPYYVDLLASVTYMLWEGLFVNARYQYGITPVRRFGNTPADFGGGNQFNNMVSFRLGYIF